MTVEPHDGTTRRDHPNAGGGASAPPLDGSTGIPQGLPPSSSIRRHAMPEGASLDVLVVPADPTRTDVSGLVPAADGVAGTVCDWVAITTTTALPFIPSPLVVPLYGSLIVWAPGRAAVVGAPEQLDDIERAVVEFASGEAELREIEQKTLALVDALEADAAASLNWDFHTAERRHELAARYRDAVAVSRRLAVLAPACSATPIHPPSLASQLGERLRDRTRLADRLELATERAELAERVADTCGQRALETGIARQQAGLEWAIVVLLVVQTALLTVDLLSRGAAP